MKIVSLCDYPEHIDTVARWNWGAFCENDRPSVTLDIVRNKLKMHKHGALPHAYIALEDDVPVGTVTLYDNDLKGEDVTPWLGSLFVPENHRCHGIAKKLIDHICKVAHELGYDAIYLRTEHTAKYYEKLGWQLVKHTVDPVYQLSTSVYRMDIASRDK